MSELVGSTTVLVAAPDGAWPTPRPRTDGAGDAGDRHGGTHIGIVGRLIESAGDSGAVRAAVRGVDGVECVVAEFVGVTPAANALYRWVAELRATAAAAGITVDLGGVRLVGTTGGSAGSTSGARAAAHEQWSPLLAVAQPGEILVDATIAVLAGQMASGRAELIYRGTHLEQHGGSLARSYRLHCLPSGTVATRPANLGWARRTPASNAESVEAAMAAALGLWERCLAGESSCLLSSSSDEATNAVIAAEVALVLHARGAAILHGRWEPDTDGACAALDEAIDDCLATWLPSRWPRAWTITGGGTVRGGRHHPPRPVAARRPSSAAAAAASVLTSVTDDWPVVLVLECLGWDDDDALATLASLRRRTSAQRLLVVVTAATDAADDVPSDVRELFNAVIGDPAVLAARQPALVGAARDNAQRDG